MNKRQKKLIGIISKKAVRFDWEKAFGGKSKGNKHLSRVAKIAGYLQKKEGGEKFIILAGAWVHDVSLAYGNDNDPKIIKKQTKKFLKGFKDLTAEEIDKITRCATSHEVGGEGLDLEAKITHDADVIDKSGMLGVIRHAWKMANMIDNRILNKKHDLEVLENHLKTRGLKVFTDTARKIIKRLNKGSDGFFQDKIFAKKTIKEISIKARKGIISDEIAQKIMKTGNPSMQLLKKQLTCDFLNLRSGPNIFNDKIKT